ncbi:cystathionine gamma-lyase cys3 [Aspergillus pseudonomiae]
MFILTTLSDLIQISPEDFSKYSSIAIEDNINEKYANKVIQKVGLCIGFYDLLESSDGLIGHGTGLVNVNVKFRLIVFRPFKGEIMLGKISSATEHGIKIAVEFFNDILVPPNLLLDGARFDYADQVWIWENEDGSTFYFDIGEVVRFRVEIEEWHDQIPNAPDLGDAAALERKPPDTPRDHVRSPVTMTNSTNGAPAQEKRFGTLAVHSGAHHDPTTGAVIAPTSVGSPVGIYEYTRSSNPNRDNFEEAIAALEHAKYALAFSSGSATTAVILQSLAAGSHVVSVSDVYGGTHRYFTKVANAHGVDVSFTPTIESDVEKLIRPETKLVWIETPSNPTLGLVDIEKVAAIAHRHGIVVVVDNTFMSPYVQNPLDHGADIVVHSVTKYINGHSDVLMGVAAFNSDSLKERLGFLQNAIGAVPSPFDCWLAHRGLKTLHLRAREATTNATAIAKALEASPHVISVNYPGIDSHPQRAIAVKQHRQGMGGGMLSFRIQGGEKAAHLFCKYTKVFTLAESLGGVESLCEVPASMTHAGIPKDQREAAGVFDDLVRMSCGVEDAEDLLADVLQALKKAAASGEQNGTA